MRALWRTLAPIGPPLARLATIIGGLYAGIQLVDLWKERAAPPAVESASGNHTDDSTDPPKPKEEGSGTAPLPRLPPDTRPEPERTKTGEPAVPDAGFINRAVVPSSSAPVLALAIDGDPADVERLEGSLAQGLSSSSLHVVPGLFKPAFRTRGFLRSAYAGDTEVLSRSGALELVDRILVGQLERECDKKDQLDADLVTCKLDLLYKTVDRRGAVSSSGSVSVIGAGFSEDAARDRAIEMLIEQNGHRLITFD